MDFESDCSDCFWYCMLDLIKIIRTTSKPFNENYQWEKNHTETQKQKKTKKRRQEFRTMSRGYRYIWPCLYKTIHISVSVFFSTYVPTMNLELKYTYIFLLVAWIAPVERNDLDDYQGACAIRKAAQNEIQNSLRIHLRTEIVIHHYYPCGTFLVEKGPFMRYSLGNWVINFRNWIKEVQGRTYILWGS